MNKPINILFMGTTDFSQAVLTQLLAMKDVFNIVGVVCQPDRFRGRKHEIVHAPVKTLALQAQLPIFQPVKVSDQLSEWQNLDIDVIITCAYGQFLPAKVLALPKLLALNIHASLLPQLRGGAPIHWAIIKNLPTTGISFMKMSQQMDAGDVFVQQAVPITKDETYQSLKVKLINLTKMMLEQSLLPVINQQITAQPQNREQVTFGLNITRTDELINWQQSATLVACQVRGLYDVPIAYTTMNDFIYKVHSVAISTVPSQQKPGTITQINKTGIFVATIDYDVIIKQIQPAGKQVMSTSNYFGSKTNPLATNMSFN